MTHPMSERLESMAERLVGHPQSLAHVMLAIGLMREAAAEIDRLQGQNKTSITRLVSIMATVRVHNTPDWMDWIASVMNKALEDVGETDRLGLCRDGIRVDYEASAAARKDADQ